MELRGLLPVLVPIRRGRLEVEDEPPRRQVLHLVGREQVVDARHVEVLRRRTTKLSGGGAVATINPEKPVPPRRPLQRLVRRHPFV